MSNTVKAFEREWGRRYWLPLLFRREIRLPATGPIVTFSFDDYPRSAQMVGGAILKSFDLRGTFYTSYGLVGTADVHSGDLFCLEDLYRLVEDGHELASHTFHHVSGRETPRTAFAREVLDGRAAMQSIPGLLVSNNFSYPFGAVTAATKRDVGRTMLSCRGIFRGVNGPVVDLNLLRANPLYGGIEQIDLVRRLLDRTQELGGWLIFYTHDVQNHPGRYGCTPALLDAAIKAALESSSRIMTVSDVLATVVNPLPDTKTPYSPCDAAH